MPPEPGLVTDIKNRFIGHFHPERKKSSKDSLERSDTGISVDTSDDKIGGQEDRTTVASPVEDGRTRRLVGNAIHHCMDSFRRRKNNLTGARMAQLKDIDAEDDIVILVMGSTGVGKTTFIKSIAGTGEGVEYLKTDIGHDLAAGTKVVSCVKIPIPETKSSIVLVDTPGFDDPERTNAQILELIAKWLEQSYREKRLINGIIYLHRITDIRFDSGASDTLRLFQHLCGGHVFGRVALTTSMWNEVPPTAMAQAREKEAELKDTHWRPMLVRSDPSLVARFDATTDDTARDSAVEVIWKLIQQTTDKNALLLQKEMVDEKKTLIKTKAGKAAFTMEERVAWQLKRVTEVLRLKGLQTREGDVPQTISPQMGDVDAVKG